VYISRLFDEIFFTKNLIFFFSNKTWVVFVSSNSIFDVILAISFDKTNSSSALAAISFVKLESLSMEY
jgi:hypothetical protein